MIQQRRLMAAARLRHRAHGSRCSGDRIDHFRGGEIVRTVIAARDEHRAVEQLLSPTRRRAATSASAARRNPSPRRRDRRWPERHPHCGRRRPAPESYPRLPRLLLHVPRKARQRRGRCPNPGRTLPSSRVVPARRAASDQHSPIEQDRRGLSRCARHSAATPHSTCWRPAKRSRPRTLRLRLFPDRSTIAVVPPATSTLPSVRRTAVWPTRGSDIEWEEGHRSVRVQRFDSGDRASRRTSADDQHAPIVERDRYRPFTRLREGRARHPLTGGNVWHGSMDPDSVAPNGESHEQRKRQSRFHTFSRENRSRSNPRRVRAVTTAPAAPSASPQQCPWGWALARLQRFPAEKWSGQYGWA